MGDTDFAARRAIVLNTGTAPAVPPVEGLRDTPFWTNREALTAERAPLSLAVLGGGAIGVELGQAFARFGTRVTIVEAGPSLLGVEEPEAQAIVTRACAEDGIDVRTGARVTEVTWDGQEFTLHLPDETVRADRLLVSTGRRTNLGGLGLDTVGLDPGARFLDPDGRMRVADGIYAVGDITGRGQFTHVSMYQADIAARDILGIDGPEAEYHAIPHVTFTDPEVGSVGLTEAQAREQGLAVRTSTTQVPESSRGWIHEVGNAGVIKLVADTERDVLVGATSVGPWGGEVLSALAVAVHARTPVATLRHLPFAFPTFHRAIGDALERLGTDSA
ncbi:dihydrolipoyl dehydrogenase family protein [Spiractinospora alimapuensis]|uniref:dihydrolipoyl dehydrogenase family protein n=1 Tax=Spiractinospora alimapuensis TaxID=2820884 RepID=UPI001F19DE1B|nr:NAD(P)/FAD-dependent oxidoreductase [Spiractinospora alimapuensis]